MKGEEGVIRRGGFDVHVGCNLRALVDFVEEGSCDLGGSRMPLDAPELLPLGLGRECRLWVEEEEEVDLDFP